MPKNLLAQACIRALESLSQGAHEFNESLYFKIKRKEGNNGYISNRIALIFSKVNILRLCLDSACGIFLHIFAYKECFVCVMFGKMDKHAQCRK